MSQYEETYGRYCLPAEPKTSGRYCLPVFKPPPLKQRGLTVLMSVWASFFCAEHAVMPHRGIMVCLFTVLGVANILVALGIMLWPNDPSGSEEISPHNCASHPMDGFS